MQAIATRLSYGPHVLWIFFLTFTAFILLLLTIFSSPFINDIYFLRQEGVNYGAFGWSSPTFSLKSTLGYEYGLEVLSPLTDPMILWGIAEIFVLFTFLAILPLLWVHHDDQGLYSGANSTFFLFCSWMAVMLTSIAWVITIEGWSNAKRAFQITNVGSDATLGSAVWLSMVATILLWLVILVGFPVDSYGRQIGQGGPNDFYHYRQTVREVQRPRI